MKRSTCRILVVKLPRSDVRARSLPTVLKPAIVEDATMVHFLESQCEDKVGDPSSLNLCYLYSPIETPSERFLRDLNRSSIDLRFLERGGQDPTHYRSALYAWLSLSFFPLSGLMTVGCRSLFPLTNACIIQSIFAPEPPSLSLHLTKKMASSKRTRPNSADAVTSNRIKKAKLGS